MNHHTLSDDAFGALAAGRPAPDTVAELSRAHRGRHLLLLTELVRAAPAARPDLLARAADPAALADPLRAAWAAAALRDLRSGGAALVVPDPPGPGRVLGATHDGLTLTVRLEDTDPLRAALGLTPAGPLTAAEAAHWQHCLTGAWRTLVTRHRTEAATLPGVLTVLVPVRPDPAASGISATSADAFGAVAVSTPRDGTVLAVALLHETRHSLLNAVQHLFDLHRFPDAPGYSPWRDDPRPASGVLHGAYAYLAVTRFWRTERTVAGRAAQFEFARWRAAVADTADGLLTGGGLTAAGERFVTALRDEVRPWLGEPVDEDVARLAAGANSDHRLRWRLRNLRVDPADAAALADAARTGTAPPPGALRSTPAAAPRRALEDNPRLRLAHRLLTGAAPGEAGPGDLAYLRGDRAAALRAYRDRILAEPGDDAAWAGLALAAGLTGHRVELAAAAGRAAAARGLAPDPLEMLRLVP